MRVILPLGKFFQVLLFPSLKLPDHKKFVVTAVITWEIRTYFHGGNLKKKFRDHKDGVSFVVEVTGSVNGW